MNGFKVKENEDGDMVLSKEYYEELVEAAEWLQCLEAAGVDNWDGVSYAHELMED